MNKQAFAGVDPARLAEMRHRVALVKRYIRSSRTAANRERAADELGITPGQFGRLVRAWQKTGSPKDLGGAGLSNGQLRASDRLDPAVRTVLAQAIVDAAPDVRAATLLKEVRRICEAKEITPPSPNTVTQHLKRAREKGKAVGVGEHHIALALCEFRFAVESAGSVLRPWALLAVAIPEGMIVALETGVGNFDAQATTRLLAQLATLHSDAAEPISVEAHPSLAKSTGAVGTVRLTPSTRARTSVSRLLGGGIGGLRIAFGARSERDLQKTGRGRLNRPVATDDADILIRAAVKDHNDARAATAAIGST